MTDTLDLGIDIDRVINLGSFKIDLTCKECLQILTLDNSKTCNTQKCSGQYCGNCPINACYICKQQISEPLKKDFKSILEKLIIKCKHENCRFSIQYAELDMHERNCSYKLIKCNKCNLTLPSKDYDEHDKDHCPKNIIKCEECIFSGRFINDHSHSTVTFLNNIIEEINKKHSLKFNALEGKYKDLEYKYKTLETSFQEKLEEKVDLIETKFRELISRSQILEANLNIKLENQNNDLNQKIKEQSDQFDTSLKEELLKASKTIEDNVIEYMNIKINNLGVQVQEMKENYQKMIETVNNMKNANYNTQIVHEKSIPHLNETEIDILDKIDNKGSDHDRLVKEELKIVLQDNITCYLYLEYYDKDKVLLGTNKSSLFMYSITEATVPKEYTIISGNVNCIQSLHYYRKDLFICGCDNKTLYLFEINNSQPLKIINHISFVFSICGLPFFNNKASFAVGGNNCIILYNLQENLSLKAKKIEQKDNFVFVIKSIADNLIVSGHENGNIRLWNIKHNLCEKSFITEYKNDITHITVMRKDMFITCDKLNSDIKLWSIDSETSLFTIRTDGSYLVSMCIVKESDLLVCSYFDKNLRLFDLNTRKQIDRVECGQVVAQITTYEDCPYKFIRRFGGKEIHFS